jgi:hypothetical protein
MALIRYAEGQQRSGSMGATVYSHNRFGQYIRSRSVPVNPQSTRQILARNRITSLSAAWRDVLTEAQREAWGIYADNTAWVNKLGDSVTLSGQNMYCRSNAAVLQAGLARVDDAPTEFGLAVAEGSLGLAGSEATQTILVQYDDGADWCSEDDAAQLLYLGLPQSASIHFFGGPYRFAGVILGDAGTPPTSPHSISGTDLPYPIAAGQRLWVRTRVLRADGRLSGFAQDNFLCGA